jgi:hypothetical protein
VTTLEKLEKKYPDRFITIETFMADYLRHISSPRYLLRKIRGKQIDIKISPVTSATRRTWIIYLHDLATWLDRQEEAAKAA